jgi:acyl-CoA reductase-like NAD-dependent aldehyde dehydrogenase
MLTVFSPYNRQPVGEIPLHTAADVENALSTASARYHDRKKWLPKHERIAILNRLADLLTSRFDDFLTTAISEGGKPHVDSVVEVQRAIQGIRNAVTQLEVMHGEEIPMGLTAGTANRWANTIIEPVGVIVAVSAFNHPLNLIIHQVIPAIAVGAPVIIKPGLTTPLSCLKLVDLIHEAGLPNGWVQAIVCENDVAEKLVTDSRVAFFSFIGSAKVGWYLKNKLAPGVGCVLEHGGAAPVIIDQEADIDTLIAPLIKSSYYHAGQVCVSTQRIYIHVQRYNEFRDKFIAMAQTQPVGDPMKPDTLIGPLILPREVERIHSWVSEAKAQGATIPLGGQALSETTYAVTVIEHAPDHAKVSKEEIFGPVACLYSFTDLDQAIARANDTPFAFQSSIFTPNINKALYAAQQLRGTAVMINDHTAFRCDWMPFGGFSVSGIGFGGIPYTMKDYTRKKLVVIKSGSWAS